MQNLHSIDAVLAYFDPGSGSLLVQAVVGGTAGLAVFARYLWNSAPALFHSRKLVRIERADARYAAERSEASDGHRSRFS